MQQNRSGNGSNSTPINEETTQPTTETRNKAGKSAGKQRRDKSDLGENFVAPDGGWAWLVCMASGLSFFSNNPAMEQFGFIYRERLQNVGMSTAQVTTIFNTCCAIAACTGIINGPLYRRFTFRQTGIFGSLLVFGGLFMSGFCFTFAGFLIFYSLVYGVGIAVCFSASSMALNTYFKENRRKAAGFAWTIAGLGPIIFPAIITLLIVSFGIQTTIFIFAAIGLHSLPCSLIYQPVRYHVKPAAQLKSEQSNNDLEANLLCEYCKQKQSADGANSVLDIEANTPLHSLAKADHSGSIKSLHSNEERIRSTSDVESNKAFEAPEQFSKNSCTCSEQQPLVQQPAKPNLKLENNAADNDKSAANTNFLQKFIASLDLNLLRDVTFVNIVLGLAVMQFTEINFNMLAPFILHDFGFTTPQVTLLCSLLAGMDIIMRFLVPFITAKLHWDNRVFFLVGIMGLVVGRTILACSRSYPIILGAFAWMGLCKGIRAIFWYLILPGYVPLKRLPAAMGLMLLTLGLFTMAAGPFVGLIRDKWNFSVTLHCLNGIALLAAFFWGLEVVVRRWKRPKNAN